MDALPDGLQEDTPDAAEELLTPEDLLEKPEDILNEPDPLDSELKPEDGELQDALPRDLVGQPVSNEPITDEQPDEIIEILPN